MPREGSRLNVVFPAKTVAMIFLLVVVSAVGIYTVMNGKLPFQGTVTTNSQGNIVITQTSGGGNSVVTYAGGVSLTVSQVWAYDMSTALTSGVTGDLYHADGVNLIKSGITLAGTANTGINLSPADQGIGVLYIKDIIVALQTAWIDPAFTVANNAPYITGWSAMKDINNDGYKDLAFTINFNAFATCNSCTVSTGSLNLYGWKLSILSASTSASGSITKQISPTGAATSGDYHYTGYVGNATTSLAGYEIKVLAVRLWASHVAGTANTTASSMNQYINNGQVQVKGISLYGRGAKTGTIYGWSWGSTNIAGTQQTQLPTYDASNTRFVLFMANPTPLTSFGTSAPNDVTQPEWGYPIVWEYGSAASFFSYDIWIHTAAGALTTGDYYYLTLELDTQASASSQIAAVKITVQG